MVAEERSGEVLMDDLKKIVEELQNYPLHIYMATITAEDLRTTQETEKTKQEYEFAKEFLRAKAADFTDGEARQKATVEVYPLTMNVIMAESAYRKAVADMNKMENEFAAVRKNVGLQEAVILKLGTSLAQLQKHSITHPVHGMAGNLLAERWYLDMLQGTIKRLAELDTTLDRLEADTAWAKRNSEIVRLHQR